MSVSWEHVRHEESAAFAADAGLAGRASWAAGQRLHVSAESLIHLGIQVTKGENPFV